MATLRDWLATCQPSVPAVCYFLALISFRFSWHVAYCKIWCEHATGDHQVGKHESRHTERQKDRLTGVLLVISLLFLIFNTNCPYQGVLSSR